MSKPVIIVGGGGHASVLIDALQLLKRDIIGVVDPALTPGDLALGRVVVLGGDDCLKEYPKCDVELVNAIGFLPGQMLRKSIYERFLAQGYSFSSVVHPSAIVPSTVVLGVGVQVMAGVVLQANTIIGSNSIINTRAGIDHDCTIGEHCHIAPAATLCGDVSVGDNVHVGAAATIIQGVSVAENCLVGAGSLLTKNLLNNQAVYSPRSVIKAIQGKES